MNWFLQNWRQGQPDPIDNKATCLYTETNGIPPDHDGDDDDDEDADDMTTIPDICHFFSTYAIFG